MAATMTTANRVNFMPKHDAAENPKTGAEGAQAYASDAAKWQALRSRDVNADGHFYYSVKTTGVYCLPSCAARPARAENVAFHASPTAATQAGFRPCKRCRPDLPPRAEREAAIVASACRRMESAETAPTLSDLAQQLGVSAHHFHRLFKRVTGVTPKAVQMSGRLYSRSG